MKRNYMGLIRVPANGNGSTFSLKPLLSHVKKVTTKIKVIYKIRRYLDNFSALAICKQMIMPLFDYSDFVLLSCPNTDHEDLQVIQNNALHLL